MSVNTYVGMCLVTVLGLICLWEVVDLRRKGFLSNRALGLLIVLGPPSWFVQVVAIYNLQLSNLGWAVALAITLIAFTCFMAVQSLAEKKIFTKHGTTLLISFGEVLYPALLIMLLPEGIHTLINLK